MSKFEIKLSKSITWDPLNQISALIAGSRGSGKTYLLMYLVRSLAVSGGQIYVIDVKNDLAQIKPLLPADRVAINADEALKLLIHFRDLMFKRLDLIKDKGHFATAKSLELSPFYLIIDEFSSLNLSLSGVSKEEKSKKFEFNKLLKEVILLGRSAGFGLIVTSQQISVQNSGISTDIQENIGLRVHMGMASKTAYANTFGYDFEIPESLYLKPSQGLIWLDSQEFGQTVRGFAAPRISQNPWNLLKEAFENTQDERKYLI